MIVFKTFLKVLKKCMAPIIMYTVFLVFFGGFNMQTSDTSTNFVASKPDVLVINYGQDKGVTKNLISYIKKNSNHVKIAHAEEAINDALFYRDINYVIYIPKQFREDFLNGENPEIKVKSTGDYQASLAELLLEKYMKVASIYQKSGYSEEELLTNIDNTLGKETKVEITARRDTAQLSKATFYYNFTNYCLLAGCIYVICLILSSFKSDKIKKRTIISSMNYKEYNRKLLLSNSLFAIVLWLFYVLLSFILLGDIMFSLYGVFYIINSFVFTLCALSIAFLIGNLINNKNAINGLVNVIALGSSFLCGAFVPMEWLPDSVLTIAHLLPSYWFIKTNEVLKTIEVFTMDSIMPIIVQMVVVVGFTILFIIISNFVSGKNRTIG